MRVFLLALAALLTVQTCCFARIIDSYRGIQPGSGTPRSVSTPSPNNDNVVSGNTNIVTLARPAEFTFGAVIPYDFSFNVLTSGGTTEYSVRITVQNNSGQPWTGFKFQIGRGVGASFQLGSVDIPGLQLPDFDLPTLDPAVTSDRFASVLASAYEITFTNGTVPPTNNGPPAQFAAFTFSIDVPDDVGVDMYSDFTLRQVPVPEPSTFALLALGAAGVCLHCSRRRGN